MMADWDVVGTAPYTPPSQGGGQAPQQATLGGGALAVAGRSFMRGYREGEPKDVAGKGGFTDDPTTDTRAEWARNLGIDLRPKPQTAAEKQQAQAAADQQAKLDKQRGGFWLSSVPEFAGEMAGAGPGGASKIGASKLIGPVARAATERWPSITRAIGNVAERIPGVRDTFLAAKDPQTLRGAAGISSQRTAQELAESGSLNAARRTDVNLSQMGQGTWGLRGGGAPTQLERLSARLPGGAPVKRAIVAADVRAQGLKADEIAQNLSASSKGGISTSASAYGKLTPAERQRIATFWRSGAPDRVWQALRDPQQVQLIQQATSVLSPNSRRYLAGEMLSRMGRNPRGGAFSADQFLKEWGAMDGAARDAVFGERAIGSTYARDMTELATNVQRIQAYAQTAGPLRNAISKLPKLGTAGTAVVAVGGYVTLEHIIGGLLSPKIALAAGAVSVGNIVTAQALTNPATVKWLARQSTKMVAAYETAHGADWMTDMHNAVNAGAEYAPQSTGGRQ